MRVSFETTRLSAQCLIEAYECLAPSRRRPCGGPEPTASPTRPAPSRAGKVSMRDPQAALYARVSSEQQAHGGTIASQVASLRERIAADGARLEPEHVFLDEGYSGASLLRPALERLRDAAAAGAVDRLYVHSPDRLARRYAYQVLLIEEFRRAGVEIVFLNRPIGGSAEDDLLLQVQGMIAEYERAKILERGRRGRRHAARSGSVSALCAAPFGYRYVAKAAGGGVARFEVVEEEARIVRQIFAWVGLERVSLHEVCRRLAEAGYRTRTGLARWDPTTVCGMLKNPAYIGQACFGRSRFVPARPRLRPIRGRPWPARKANTRVPVAREEWIEVPVPALVEPALFEAAQAQLEENRRHKREGRRRPGWLLQGLVVCRRCGYAFYGKMARGPGRAAAGRPSTATTAASAPTGIASAGWRRATTARCAATASSWRSGTRSGPSWRTRSASPPSTGAASTSCIAASPTRTSPRLSIARSRACAGASAG